jgi:cell division protein FtsB
MEIERLARERYGMIKPNEEILFISSSPKEK